jgi:hypothetical protein
MRSSLKEALELFHLSSPFSIKDLKIAFREETRNCHPDHCQDEQGKDKFEKVHHAFKILLAYAEHYPILLDEKLFTPESYEEWWAEHFGGDPI